MAFDFTLVLWHNFWRKFLCAIIDQCAGDNHFSFIAAVGAFAYMFEFLLCHFIYLYFAGLLDTYDLDKVSLEHLPKVRLEQRGSCHP
jgi:hypothetical protein